MPDRKLTGNTIQCCFYLGLPALLFISLFTKTEPDLLSPAEITHHIDGCGRNSRESQKIIYMSFYAYAMTICECYTNNKEDAVEILNDGFLKIFKEIHRYK